MGILLARILQWVAISFSRSSSQTRDGTGISHIAGRFFSTEPPAKPNLDVYSLYKFILVSLLILNFLTVTLKIIYIYHDSFPQILQCEKKCSPYDHSSMTVPNINNNSLIKPDTQSIGLHSNSPTYLFMRIQS